MDEKYSASSSSVQTCSNVCPHAYGTRNQFEFISRNQPLAITITAVNITNIEIEIYTFNGNL